MTRKLTSSSRGVTHHSANRTRLRLPKHHRQKHKLSTVKKRLEKVPGVKEVEINERTGSILVHHEDASENSLENIGNAIEEVAMEAFEALLDIEEESVPGLSILSHLLKKNLSEADTKVASATNNMFDLKTLVPLGFLGLALFKLAKDKALLAEVPAFVLLYYAYDSYIKFHGPGVRPISVAEREVEDSGKLANPVQKELQQQRSKKNGN
jgi:copper chaperone CopZ